MKPAIQVERRDRGLAVHNGPLAFEIDAATGSLIYLRMGDKVLVAKHEQPPLSATLMHSDMWNGLDDHVPDAVCHEARYMLDGLEHQHDADRFTADISGQLLFADENAIRFTINLTTRAGQPALHMALRLRAEGGFQRQYLRQLAWHLPLTLRHRKRIPHGGDGGRLWEVRHLYDFHLRPGGAILPFPDHNEWRHIAVEQDAVNHFRIWRAESDHTAGLTAQHGEQAPGWIGAYDIDGGILVGYRHMARLAPKMLHVDAGDGGSVQVWLHPPTCAAADPLGFATATSLWNEPHEIDLVAHLGEFAQARPDRVLESIRGAAVDTARSALEDDDLPVRHQSPAPEGLSPMVTGGVPLPRGRLFKPSHVRLFCIGREVMVQTRVTGWWPDGSVKWLLLTFPLEGSTDVEPGAGAGEVLPFQVTLRDGAPRAYELHYGSQVQAARPRRSVTAKADDAGISIDTGVLALRVQRGEQWLRDLKIGGRDVLAQGGDAPLACVDFVRPERSYVVGTSHGSGHADPGPVMIEHVELEESGPLRAVVRLGGRALCREPAKVTIRLEVDAGRPWLKMTHSVVFMHQDPREVFLRRMAVTLPLALRHGKPNVTVGGEAGPLPVDAGAQCVVLRQHSHRHGDVTEVRQGRCARSHDLRRSGGWMDMRATGHAAGTGIGVTAVLRSMWQSYPKALVMTRNPDSLSVELWPASAPLMDVRRYSQWPHVSQGESTRSGYDPEDNTADWVQSVYYAQEPFVGVSRTHEMLWLFHDGDCDAAAIDAVAADVQSPPLVWAGEAWYCHTQIALPVPDWKHAPEMAANLDAMVDFWLFHQRIWGWYGMWDYGDLRHRMADGHGSIVPPDDLARQLALPAGLRTSSDIPSVMDYSPEQDWAFDNGRWGWSNTEGLPGMFLQMQYLRTGRRDVFFAAEAMAQHVRDVDMRHAGRWLGRGTRHGVQHWSDGNHEERQTAHGEFRWMYHLTGDARSADLAALMLREVYTRRRVAVHADHSGRLLGLLVNWELTGDSALGKLLADYTRQFIVEQGLAISPAIVFDTMTRTATNDINSGNMFFHGFGGMHALIEYVQLAGDAAQPLRQALIAMAAAMLRDPTTQTCIGQGAINVWSTFQPVMAFAAAHADDPAPYRQALETWRERGGWRYLYHAVLRDHRHWTGRGSPLAHAVGSLMLLMNWLPYIASVLNEPTPLPQEQRRQMATREQQGLPDQRFRPSWQLEYDDVRFDDYLRPNRGDSADPSRPN